MRPKKRRRSGPSGVSKLPRVTLRATADELEAWREAAAVRGWTLNQWLRYAANTCANRDGDYWRRP